MNQQPLKDSEQQPTAAKTPLVKGVHCTYLPVSSLERSRTWYMQALGLKPFERNDSILIMGSGQWIFLLESKDRPNANFTTDQWEGDNFEMFSLTFETGDILTLHQSLREHGASVEAITDNGSCGLQFRFKDPDGNRFNVWQN
ncbi:VOC family protein [Paenibacillus soyae]|uniref:VOC family protein n=1 Tax=Paenibacillus soyae TaxID=2969249 RepID=A0A9X2MNI2_9BACL|nr:VOC family protein [Paenibacillus soyae]MCR2803535.1 VOC family protein [Paenibacillus soyae]